jgi:hypothetical protein
LSPLNSLTFWLPDCLIVRFLVNSLGKFLFDLLVNLLINCLVGFLVRVHYFWCQ